MRRVLAVLTVCLLSSLAQVEAGAIKKASRPIRGSYIVVLKNTSTDAATTAAVHAASGRFKVKHTYGHALRGYAAVMTEEAAAALASDPSVESVEEDFVVEASATQSGATWGLDRIDQRNLPLSGTYTYNFDGAGVHVYIIDTGIFAGHSQFAGRMGNGFDAVGDGNGTNDCNGHGTHVAGTVGGSIHGIAKRVTLHAVRVLGCNGSGSGSGVIAGIDWVRANHQSPAVANMSLGGGASAVEDAAVTNAVNSGVVFAVAAGNANTNACTTSPARAPAALTVGATASNDARASFSNWGTCLDLFAPGQGITSTWNNGGTNSISGTSMASPHVAGVAALYRQQFPGASASSVSAAIVAAATTGNVTSAGTGSPNRFLYSLFGGTTPTPTPGPGGTIVVDNGTASFSTGGAWTASTSTPGFLGSNYLHDGSAAVDAGKWAKWKPTFPTTRSYTVFARWTSASNRPSSIRYRISHQGVVTDVVQNQQVNGGTWVNLGTYTFGAGNSEANRVTLDAGSAAGFVIADAVQFVP